MAVVELDDELLGFGGVLAAAPALSASQERGRLLRGNMLWNAWDSHLRDEIEQLSSFHHICFCDCI